MESPILKQIAKFLQDKKRYKRWLAVFVCLAVIVGFTTAAALKMRGRAMTHDERVLACKLEVHQHTEACYDQEKNIICGYADYAVHRHNEDCYDAKSGSLACTLPEVEAHQHTDGCYQEEEALACGLEESEGHQHTDGCYTREQGELTCQAEEHTHTEECQGEDGTIICEKEEHTHTDECYEWDEALACQQEESEGHTHTAECYQVQKTLVCQEPEVEVHTHGDGCYERVLITPDGQETVQDPEGNVGIAEKVLAGTANEELPEGRIEVRRTCGKLQVEEHTHTQENGCIEIHEVLDGTDLNPVEEPAESSEGATPEDGTEDQIVKTFEGEGFIVTAVYGAAANIPENAEFVAEQITAESNAEHYAEREAEFRENMENKDATMRALLKVGFYVGGQEIEPESPVELTVQLLDDEGLPTGTPITVVHFAEDGTKKLDGGKAENDSTTFSMDGFSEIAVGFDEVMPLSLDGSEDGGDNASQRNESKYFINKDYEYKGVAFNTIFHIEGSVILPEIKGETQETDSEAGDGNTEENGGAENTDTEDTSGAESADTEEIVETEGTDTEEDFPGEADGTGDLSDGNAEGAETDSLETEDQGDAPAVSETEEGDSAAQDSPEAEEDVMPGESEESGAAPDDSEDASTDDGESDGIIPEDTVPANTEEEVNGYGLELKVKTLDKNSDAHKAVVSYTAEMEEMSKLTSIETMTYSLAYGGEIVDLSNCEVSVVITPGNRLAKSMKKASGGNGIDVQMAAFAVSDDAEGVTQLENEDEKPTTRRIKVSLEDGISTFSANSTELDNPEFTVQYYAKIDEIDHDVNGGGPVGLDSEYGSIELIDTSAYEAGTGEALLNGAVLPQNGTTSPIKYMYVKKGNPIAGKGANWYEKSEVIYKNSLKEIFKNETYNYINYRQLENFNKFAAKDSAEETHYNVNEIWVLKDGKDPKSLNEGDWDIVRGADFERLEFTNNPEAADESNVVLIKNGSVIRLVAQSEKGMFNNSAAFYDFDITDGKAYSDENLKNLESNRDSASTLYVSTNRQGINAKDNYDKTPNLPLYGFGNNNVGGTGVQSEKLNGYYINQASSGTGGCAFGLVDRTLGDDGYPVFNVNAPDVFGNGSATGKTAIPGYSLDFIRNGDTYTLTAVKDGKMEDSNIRSKNLDQFWVRPNWNNTRIAWSNNFWALDTADTFGKDGHDLKFGDKANEAIRKAKGDTGTVTLPVGDDEKDHNSYFSMNFSVNFKLTADYLGPLNYYFFGDDDMWVFLDGKLICDIGGVHSSVGEYVDLWNYIPKGDANEHTLKFFYTERGASGSTCWMQFTLPSVSANPVSEETGDCKNTLTVNKKVENDTNIQISPDEEYEFTITFFKKDGQQSLNDYYEYEILDASGNRVKSGSIKTKDTFKLKANQSIIVRNLPDGAKYTVQEKNFDGYQSIVNGNITANGMAEGSIDWTVDNVENYVNEVIPYELPETGGFGTTLYTMAGVAAILLGAGLLYRKKFREGRVGGSS